MKTLKFLAVSALALAIAPAFNSCKSDDAPDDPNESESAVIDGTHLTSINNVTIGYDQHNRPVSFTDRNEDDDISIDYSAKKIYYDDGEMNVKFNDKGFITEMSASWDEKYKEDGEEYHSKGSGKITFSYDKNDCLTSMKENSSETEKYDGNTYKYTSDVKMDLDWRNGNLVMITGEEKEEENGVKEEYFYKVDVEYGNDVNAYKQFPLSIVQATDVEFDVLFSVGLFGNGPAYLPEKVTWTEGNDNRSYQVSFTLNDNGSFRTETGAYYTWNYGYSAVSRANAFTGGKKVNLKSLKNVFRHSHRK